MPWLEGKYIWIAESDDLADPLLLEVLADRLDENPEVGLAYSQSFYIDERSRIIGLHLKDLQKQDRSLWQNDFICSGGEMLASHMAAINVIPNASAVLFRKAVFVEAGGADGHMKLCGDWMCWSKMLLISNIAFVSRPLNYFRVHSSTVRSQVHKTLRYITEYLEVLNFIHNNVEVSGPTKRKAAYHLRIRWLQFVINKPSEITISAVRHIFVSAYRLFGAIEAVQFLLLGCLPLISFMYKSLFRIQNVYQNGQKHPF